MVVKKSRTSVPTKNKKTSKKTKSSTGSKGKNSVKPVKSTRGKDFLLGAAAGTAITGVAANIYKGVKLLNAVKSSTNKNLQLDVATEEIETNTRSLSRSGGIPKIIHQIWLGPRDPPMEWISQTEKFCKDNGWRHVLYRDADIDKLGLINKEAFTATKIWQEKADIARYEILYRYGGLYIDTDIVPIRKDLSTLLQFSTSTFVAVQEALPGNLLERLGKPYVANGIIACVPGHTIMKAVIKELANRKDSKKGVLYRTGPMLLNSCITTPITIIPSQWAFPFGHHLFAAPKNTNIEDLKKIAIFYSSSNAKNDSIYETLIRAAKF